MNNTLRIKLVFLVLFAIGCAAIWSYQLFYAWPRERCEGHGGWWDSKTRICAQPILLPKLTGRPFGAPKMITPLTSGDQESDLIAPSSRVEPGVQSTSPAP